MIRLACFRFHSIDERTINEYVIPGRREISSAFADIDRRAALATQSESQSRIMRIYFEGVKGGAVSRRRQMLHTESAVYMAIASWCLVTSQSYNSMLSLPLRRLGLDILAIGASTKVNLLPSSSTALLGKSRRATGVKE